MRTVSIGFAAILSLLTVHVAIPAADAGERKAVVELFTSQGCSSCPPADELAATLVKTRDDVLVLSLAVDYWDFLGWPDTLADPAHSSRQRAYAVRRGDKAIYTPQMVINGRAHIVGSDRKALERALATPANKYGELPLNVALSMNVDTIDISIAANQAEAGQMATVWALFLSSQVDVSVRAGENRGRTISYVNVVRDMLPVGVFDGPAAEFRLPSKDLMNRKIDRIAVLVQKEMDGIPAPILGAAIIEAPALAAWK